MAADRGRHESVSSDEGGLTGRWGRQKKKGKGRDAGSGVMEEEEEEDEDEEIGEISLDQFLAECNRSPKSRVSSFSLIDL